MIVAGILLAGLLWLGLGFALFACWAGFDEDTDHWNWPEGREGPASRTAILAASGCLILSAVITTGAAYLIRALAQ